jgi:zonular occludens toxin Zot
MSSGPSIAPITGYVGMNGSGKTLAMVHDLAVPAIRDGMPILANLRLNYDKAVPFRSWRQLVEPMRPGCPACEKVGRTCAHLAALGGPGVVLLDEISAVLPARQAMSVPPQLVRILNQLRKAEVDLGWTAPAWARCDTVLREVTRAVAVCKGFWLDKFRRKTGTYAFPRRGPVARGDDGKPITSGAWGSHCLFRIRYYDASDFDEFSYGRIADVRPARSRWNWRPAHEAHHIYDTLEGVDLLDHLDETGVCISCGGSRRRKACNCALDSPFSQQRGVPNPRKDPAVDETVAVSAHSVDSAVLVGTSGPGSRRRQSDPVDATGRWSGGRDGWSGRQGRV